MGWLHYAESWKYYRDRWTVFNDVLYGMCRTFPAHKTLNEVIAKVGIIGRAYAAGLERHGAISSDEGAIVDVARLLWKNCREIDGLFSRLRRIAADENSVDPVSLNEVVRVHGILVDRIRTVTRDGNSLRSFASKYMHFHLPGVPVDDFRAHTVLKNWYPLRGKWQSQSAIKRPAPCDFDYFVFCNRFHKLWTEAVEANLRPTVRRLDHYLLYVHELPDF